MLPVHYLAIILSLALMWLRAPQVDAQAASSPQLPVALTEAEKNAGWRLLFDGQNPDQWRGFKQSGFPTNRWKVEDGCLHLVPHTGSGGDLVSVQKFDDFELTWEWRITFGGNSGLKYLINEENGPIGPEYQMLDDLHTDDGARGAKWVTASFYDVLPATNVVLNPLSEFNQSRLVVRGRHVEHWLNGKMTLSCELESPEFKAAVANSKFKSRAFYGVKVPGRILLQDHGGEVWFRNLRIRELH
jgi:hypothetical protein